MTYTLRFASGAIRDLKGLPRPLQRRILAKLEATTDDPARYFRRLTGRNEHRMRVGDHRVLAEIRVKDGELWILHIGHRRNVYD